MFDWLKQQIAAFLCSVYTLFARAAGRPPPLKCWLKNHPRIAAALRWQYDDGGAYQVPDSVTVAWRHWATVHQNELVSAFEEAWAWLDAAGGSPIPDDTLPYPPVNLRVGEDGQGPIVEVTEAYARELFTRWAALNLAMEIRGTLPWSVLQYDDLQLAMLFNSGSMMRRGPNGTYSIANATPEHLNYVERRDNRGSSLPAPPRYTYAFLVTNDLIGTTRLETIGRVLEWMRANMTHCYGNLTYANAEEHWQYRGCPPISRIIEGTTHPTQGFAHWTAGCHGSNGFLRNVLRAANIPVDILRVCGHGQTHFPTEGLYMDHGDDPYSSAFKVSGHPALDLLIDEATYTEWFGTSLANHEQGCDNIARRAVELGAKP